MRFPVQRHVVGSRSGCDLEIARIGEDGWTVCCVGPTDPSYDAALQLAVVGSASPCYGHRHPAVSELLSDVAGGPLRVSLVHVAFHNEKMASAAAAIESPEGSGLVLIPCDSTGRERLAGTGLALRSLASAAWSQPLDLLEVLVPSEQTALADSLSFGGFRKLTELIYLARPVEKAPQRRTNHVPSQDLNWTTFSDAVRASFCEAVRRSYVQSMDCAELTTIRTPEQAIAAHRATGIHDPGLWFVAAQGNELVGVLLMSKMRRQDALEIVYMGVSQDARGTGVADALMERALESARLVSANHLALAMDVRNLPARRFYGRWGFSRMATRCAWIATPDGKETWKPAGTRSR